MDKSKLKKFFETNSVPLNVIKYVFNENEIAPENVTNMNAMFLDAVSFNKNINNWNVTKIIYIIYMFAGAKSFNNSCIIPNLISNVTI